MGINSKLTFVEPGLKRKVLAVLDDVNSKLPKGISLFIYETDRSVAQQKIYFASGASKTMNSKHIIDKTTGYCYAVDVVFLVGKQVTWAPPLVNGKSPWKLVETSAVAHNLTRLKKNGIVWDKPHLQLNSEDIKNAKFAAIHRSSK